MKPVVWLMVMTMLWTAPALGAPPATQPEPILIPTPRPMSRQYQLPPDRTIFVKGRLASDASGGTRPAGPARPEETLVFSGVTETDYQMVAFVEDTAAGKISQLQVGDSIASGKITDITLDSLEYEADGKRTLVRVGQNLLGADALGLPSLATTQSAGSELLDRLRRRRQQELGH
ncbi:MAG: hypothetical protein ABR964_13260 [Tepidisphaeraceae bacterium]|jgi:hypothetical protein